MCVSVSKRKLLDATSVFLMSGCQSGSQGEWFLISETHALDRDCRAATAKGDVGAEDEKNPFFPEINFQDFGFGQVFGLPVSPCIQTSHRRSQERDEGLFTRL